MKIICIVLLCLMVSVTNAQNCKAFLPHSKGANWQLTNYNAKGKEIGHANYELIDVTETAGVTTFTVKVISKIGRKNKTHENMYTAKCSDGKFEFDMKQMMSGMSLEPFKEMDINVDASSLEMPGVNAKEGTALNEGTLDVKVNNDGVLVYNMNMKISERKVEARETKETPVGTFDCVKISQRVSTKTMIPIDMIIKEWHAEGIGLVASETYTVKGKLASYMNLTQLDR